MSESPLMTVPDAARLLRVHRNTIYKLIAAGRFRGVVKIGDAVRVQRAYVERVIAGEERIPAAPPPPAPLSRRR